jgi:hypothetical protein
LSAAHGQHAEQGDHPQYHHQSKTLLGRGRRVLTWPGVWQRHSGWPAGQVCARSGA